MENEEHLEKILYSFVDIAKEKYRRGVEKHGGNLWLKSDLIDQAIEEAIDQVFYLFSLKGQINESGIKLGKLKDNDSVDNFIKLPENEVVNKLSTNLACPYCNKPITDKDLKHFKCIKCKKSFKVNFNENI